MEKLYTSIAYILAPLLVLWAFNIFNWIWIRPRKLEKSLRRQYFRGNSYKFLFGDMKESFIMLKEAKSKPINFTNDILPSVFPVLHECVKNHGVNSFVWMGPTPRVNIMEPELIKEILTKSSVFPKQEGSWAGKLLANGLVRYEGEKWAKHRKIINPAFHTEKLKVPMILLEVLRLYPPLIALTRMIQKDVILGNLTLPAGFEVLLPTIMVHRDKKTWGDDANEFNPDRFAKGVSKSNKDQVSFFLFGWGPRNCVGQNFAMLEAKMAITMIVRSFRFELSSSYAHAPIETLSSSLSLLEFWYMSHEFTSKVRRQLCGNSNTFSQFAHIPKVEVNGEVL